MNIPVAYHFRVDFFGEAFGPANACDVRFQQVQGLSSEFNTQDVQEGVTMNHLSSGVKYDNLILKRGMATGSLISDYFEEALSKLSFRPANVLVTLLDSDAQPQISWLFQEASPKKWSISDLDADSNKLMIETLEFTYKKLTIKRH